MKIFITHAEYNKIYEKLDNYIHKCVYLHEDVFAYYQE